MKLIGRRIFTTMRNDKGDKIDPFDDGVFGDDRKEAVLRVFVMHGYNVKDNMVTDFDWCDTYWNIHLIYDTSFRESIGWHDMVVGFRFVNYSPYLNNYLTVKNRLSDLEMQCLNKIDEIRYRYKKRCTYIEIAGQYKTTIDWFPAKYKEVYEQDGMLVINKHE